MSYLNSLPDLSTDHNILDIDVLDNLKRELSPITPDKLKSPKNVKRSNTFTQNNSHESENEYNSVHKRKKSLSFDESHIEKQKKKFKNSDKRLSDCRTISPSLDFQDDDEFNSFLEQFSPAKELNKSNVGNSNIKKFNNLIPDTYTNEDELDPSLSTHKNHHTLINKELGTIASINDSSEPYDSSSSSSFNTLKIDLSENEESKKQTGKTKKKKKKSNNKNNKDNYNNNTNKLNNNNSKNLLYNIDASFKRQDNLNNGKENLSSDSIKLKSRKSKKSFLKISTDQLIGITNSDIEKVLLKDEKLGLDFKKLIQTNTVSYKSWSLIHNRLNLIDFYFLVGQYNFLETKLLKRNWRRLKKKIPFEKPEVIFFSKDLNDQAKDEVNQYLRSEVVYQKLGKGLNRSSNSIYNRCRSLFYKKENDGQEWTPEELEKLGLLVARHENNWRVISEEMGRSQQMCRDKYKVKKPKLALGHWTAEEDEQLVKAVNHYVRLAKQQRRKISHNGETSLGVIRIKDENVERDDDDDDDNDDGDDDNTVIDDNEEADVDLYNGLPWGEIKKKKVPTATLR